MTFISCLVLVFCNCQNFLPPFLNASNVTAPLGVSAFLASAFVTESATVAVESSESSDLDLTVILYSPSALSVVSTVSLASVLSPATFGSTETVTPLSLGSTSTVKVTSFLADVPRLTLRSTVFFSPALTVALESAFICTSLSPSFFPCRNGAGVEYSEEPIKNAVPSKKIEMPSQRHTFMLFLPVKPELHSKGL